jgi:hypothetical protein
LALKIQFRASSVFSFSVSSICRCPSLGIWYGSYFRLIQYADFRSVIIATPYIPTKVIAIQLLIARSILTVKLRAVYSLVKSGFVCCHLICRFLPHTTSDSSGFTLFGVATAEGRCRSMYSSVCPHLSLSRNPRRAYHSAVEAQQENHVEFVGATFSTEVPR